MGTAAQLDGEVAAHAQHAHLVAVLLAEQRHGALGLGGFDVGFLGLDRGVLANLGVDDVFQLFQLLGLDRLEVAEVEAQTLTVDQRALLLNVLAQHLTQRGVQQVGGRVVQRGGLTHAGLGLGLDAGADGEAALGHHAVVQEGAAGLGGVTHVEAHAGALEITAIADLAAGFGVERGLIQHHHALLAFGEAVDSSTCLEQGNDLAAAAGAFVAEEAGVGVDLDQRVVIHAEGAGGTGALTLRFHLALEAFFVHRQLALAGDVGSQVDREAVGVVQLEHHIARNDRALQAGQILLEDLQALLQGLGELLFLGLQHALDMRLLLLELGEGFAHLGHQGGDDLVEEAALGTQLVAVAAGATHDAAQHVATTFVGRGHAVGDQEAARADVVGDHLQRSLAFIGAADGLGRSGQQVLEQIDLVVGIDVLQHGADALQAHAGVHRGRRQRVQHAIGSTVELHEHVVPDLDVAVAVFFRRTGWAAPDVLAVVEEDLGAGAARAGIAHGPEVVGGVGCALVVADADHALGGNADFLGPDVVGLVIGGVDGDPELLLGQVQPLVGGQKFPGVMDGIALEVVAEAEVAQHLEEGVVARGVADVFQVVVLAAGTHALLAGGGAGVGALFQAQEAVLELVHARVGEQQGRVVRRDQRAGSDTGVPFFFEEAQEGFTDFCAFHRGIHGIRRPRQSRRSRQSENVASEGQARQKPAKKRSLRAVNEHSEPVFNAA